MRCKQWARMLGKQVPINTVPNMINMTDELPFDPTPENFWKAMEAIRTLKKQKKQLEESLEDWVTKVQRLKKELDELHQKFDELEGKSKQQNNNE